MERTTAFFSLMLLAGTASAAQTGPDPAMRDLSIVQEQAVTAGIVSADTLKVAASFDRAGLAYAVGEQVRLFVTASEDAYITVFNIGPGGNVTQLFPNKFQADNMVKANQPVEVGTGGAKILVGGPVGAELIKVFATNKPYKVAPNDQMASRGAFASLTGGISVFVQDLAKSAPDADLRMAIENRAIRTVKTKAEVAAASVVIAPEPSPALITAPPPLASPEVVAPQVVPPQVVPPEPVAPQAVAPELAAPEAAAPQAVAPPPAPVTDAQAAVVAPEPAAPLPMAATDAEMHGKALQMRLGATGKAFPLIVGTDRPSYGVNDSVTISVTTTKACNLDVFEVRPKGRARILFPNLIDQKRSIAAMETRIIAMPGSAVPLDMEGPPGPVQFIGVCSSSSEPVSGTAYDFTRMFTPAGDEETLLADIKAAAGRDGVETSVSSVTVTVTN